MSEELTAWGRWVRAQPRGTMRRAELATQIAYSTIHSALTKRTSLEVAELLSRFSRGAVHEDDIAKPRRKLVRAPKRKRTAA